MNDLFSGEISEADFLGVVTTWKGHLLADETLAEQAKANSSPDASRITTSVAAITAMR